MSVLDTFTEAVERHSMIGPDRPLVAAVSGGPDSMALLECLSEFVSVSEHSRIIVAHLHHSLRASADRDAAFVRSEAERRGATVVVEQQDVRALAAEQKRSIEDAARTARYEFLTRVAVEYDADTILTGHNADDQAETVLMRALRGTGLQGLGGMRAVRPAAVEAPRVSIARPLLEATRSEIEQFLAERDVSYCHDETNADEAYRRNFVRLRLMPLVRAELQPQATEVLCRLAQAAREAQAYIDEAAREHTPVVLPGHAFEICREKWRALPLAVRSTVLMDAYRAATNGRRMPHVHVESVCAMMDDDSTGTLDLPAGWRAEIDEHRVKILPRLDEDAGTAFEAWSSDIRIPGNVELPDGRVLSARLEPADGTPAPRTRDAHSTEEWLDYDRIGRPGRLVVRSRLPGDHFIPLGSPGARSVKRFLIDIKAPRETRSRIPVVSAPGAHVVWVAPHRMDERAKLNAETKTILRLALT